MKFQKGKELAKKLHQLVPAGGHTYSKGDDQFPELAPGLMVSAKGAYCTDADDNQFLDYGMGLRSVGLGHANDEVNQAVSASIQKGTNFTRPAKLELELAEILVEMIPSIQMVKFAKNGSDATSAAIRLARAFTSRKYVAICKDHPFYSFNDWFIGSTLCSNGVPEDISRLTLEFKYNDKSSVDELFNCYGTQLAAVILEPLKDRPPADGFLEYLREITAKNGTVLIFDEMISGFRFDLQGAQAKVGIKPDLSTFGKACANGFSMSFLGGRREIMEMGGIFHEKPRVFLLSGTHGAESTGLAAAMKNIEIYKRENVVEHHWEYGEKFQEGLNQISEELGIFNEFSIGGYPCSPVICARNRDLQPDLKFNTLFSQEMIRHGVLMPWIAFSLAHSNRELEITFSAARKSLEIYKEALSKGVDKFLVGEPIKPVWRKFN